mmetsp:Transcript_8259/g.23764  ORF Transcript_8259/g.23764 Transcript_8259/m.23764 type:complete len:389 (-) Transcript_8259:211-1377(-)
MIAPPQRTLNKRKEIQLMLLLVMLVAATLIFQVLPSLQSASSPSVATWIAIATEPDAENDAPNFKGWRGINRAKETYSAGIEGKSSTAPYTDTKAAITSTSTTAQHSDGNKTIPFQETFNHTVVVTAFFGIIDNPKHSPSHFLQGLGLTMEFFQQFQQVHYFTDVMNGTGTSRDSWNAMSAHANLEKVNFIPTSLNSLQRYSQADTLVKWCQAQTAPILSYAKNDKQRKHLRRVRLNQTVTHAWTNVMSVWISKFDFIQRVIDENPNVERVAWFDAALLGRKDMANCTLKWSNRMVDAKHIWMRKSGMVFDGTQIQYMAGVMLGPTHVFAELIAQFYKHLDWMLSQTDESDGNSKSPYEGLCHDEETILTGLLKSSSTIRKYLQDFGD